MHIVADLSDGLKPEKPALGLLYIQEEDLLFPSRDWTDFTVVVLGWWIEEFLKQITNNVPGEYQFMDGPFYIESAIEEGDFLLSFKKRGLNNPHEISFKKISIPQFNQALSVTSNQVLRICYERQYMHRDVQTLEQKYRQLQGANF